MNRNIRDMRHMRKRPTSPIRVMRSPDVQHIFYDCDSKYVKSKVSPFQVEVTDIQKNYPCIVCHESNSEIWGIYGSMASIEGLGIIVQTNDYDEVTRIHSRVGVVLPYEVVRYKKKLGLNHFTFPKINFGVHLDIDDIVITADTIEDAMEITLSH